ncbi:MAG: NYN domain-containing protein [Planctomycetota bacterium]
MTLDESRELAMPPPILLIDGYNVIAPVAAPMRGSASHWLDVERRRLLDRLADHLDDSVRRRTLVVFDAKNPPSGTESELIYRQIHIRFAVHHNEADDLIEELIAGHSAPKSLTVISSDHRIQASARRRRAAWHDSDEWMDALLDGQTRLAAKFQSPTSPNSQPPSDSKPDQGPLDAGEVQAWLDEFNQKP